MIQSFTKYTCLIVALVITTTSASHATFSLWGHQTNETKISINKHIKIPNITHKPIALLPEYCPPTTPPVPHNPPPVPHNPPTTTPPTSVSEPLSLATTLAAMSAFLYRRHKKSIK